MVVLRKSWLWLFNGSRSTLRRRRWCSSWILKLNTPLDRLVLKRGNLPLGLGDYRVSSNSMPGVPKVKLNVSLEKGFLFSCQERYLLISFPRDTQCLSRRHWANNQGCMNRPLTSLQSRFALNLGNAWRQEKPRHPARYSSIVPSDGLRRTKTLHMCSTLVVFHAVLCSPGEESVDMSVEVSLPPFNGFQFKAFIKTHSNVLRMEGKHTHKGLIK